MARVMTLQGAGLAENATTPPAEAKTLVLGWDWRHVCAMVAGGVAMLVGVGLGTYGYARERKGLLWSGVATGGAGLLAFGGGLYFARLREAGLLAGNNWADTHPPEVRLSPPLAREFTPELQLRREAVAAGSGRD